MATTKQRIAISLSKDTAEGLRLVSKRDQVPLATAASDLIRMALEIDEDMMLTKIVEERLKDNKATYIPHDQFWKIVRANRKKK